MNALLMLHLLRTLLLIAPIQSSLHPTCSTPEGFDAGVGVIISEAAGQSWGAQYLIASAFIQHDCNLEPGYFHGYRDALQWRGTEHCLFSHHCAAWFERDKYFSPATILRAEVAMRAALDSPRPIIRHFDAARASRAFFFDSSKACPLGDIVIDATRFC